jgi:hypothetical protein
MAEERRPPEPGTSFGDDPPGTPIGSDEGLTGNEFGRPPMPGETSGAPEAVEAAAVTHAADQDGLPWPDDRGRER